MAKNGNYIVVGLQFGDEGKGKIVDKVIAFLVELMDAGAVVRYNGANNAGHSVWINGHLVHIHFIPSGIVNPKCLSLMAAGELIEPFAFLKELQYVQKVGGINTAGRIIADPRMNIILFYHRIEDLAREFVRKRDKPGSEIGTTAKGVGPAYADLAQRPGIRLQDLLDSPEKFIELFEQGLENKLLFFFNVLGLQKNEEKDELKDILKILEQKDIDGSKELIEAGLVNPKAFDYSRYYCPKKGLKAEVFIKEYLEAAEKIKNQIQVRDVAFEIQKLHYSGAKIVFEGGQGSMLDVLVGTFPFLTSSHPIAGGACVGGPVGPLFFEGGEVIGVGKLVNTRVGGGPLPTEDENFAQLVRGQRGMPGAEFGTTTGRPRRCGPLDMVILRTAAMWNGINQFCGTKLDIYDSFEEIKICTHYELDGKPIYLMPTKTEELDRVVPVYITLPGWREKTSDARNWKELPVNTKGLVDRVMEEIQMPIPGANEVKLWGLGNGPDREQLIKI